MSITVNHNGLRSFNSALNPLIKAAIENNIDHSGIEISVFSVGATHNHTFADRKKLYIFNYASQRLDSVPTSVDVDNMMEMFGKQIIVTKMFAPASGGQLITDDKGTVVAQYFPENRVLNILFDLFQGNVVADEMYVLEQIIIALKQQIEDETANESWKRAKDKTYIRNKTRALIKVDFDRNIARERETAATKEREIEEYKTRLITAHNAMIKARQFVQAADTGFAAAIDKILNDFENLAALEKVVDVTMEEEYIAIHTTNIVITNPRNGNQYDGGRFIIRIRLSDATVKFEKPAGEKGHRGYWTGNDPHPHVSGNSGSPCLGSVAPTIAELCAQKEIFALGIVCISFLEAVNTDDPAGAKVSNWPLISGSHEDDEIEEEDESDDDDDEEGDNE